MSDKIAVTVPVSATLGKFRAVLVPFQVVDDGPEDCIERPWAGTGTTGHHALGAHSKASWHSASQLGRGTAR